LKVNVEGSTNPSPSFSSLGGTVGNLIDERPERAWQDVVAEAGREINPEKRAKLSKELERVLDKRRKNVPHTDATAISQTQQKTG
jgi:hypothetical protein